MSLRVINYVDKIAEECFSDEDKSVLEYREGKRNITIAHTFKKYYRKACYAYTEEDLYNDICITKRENRDILEQLKALERHLALILDPSSYDKIFTRSENSQFKSKNTQVGTDKTDTTSNTTSNATTDDISSTTSIGSAQEGSAENNSVCKLEEA